MADVEEAKRLLATMSEPELRQVLRYARGLLPKHPVEELLMITADSMLEALGRAGDFTVRMIRGVFAEAAFAADVLPTLAGWREIPVDGDPPFDFLLTDVPEGVAHPLGSLYPDVRVQVKMQRSENKKPLKASEQWKSRVSWPADHFVVEVQKSRKGEKKGESTRPYRFGEFDILAVSLGPAKGHWGAFIYTVERWLLADPVDPRQILTFQPVAPTDNESWTTSFSKAVEWLRSGVNKKIEGELPKPRRTRETSK